MLKPRCFSKDYLLEASIVAIQANAMLVESFLNVKRSLGAEIEEAILTGWRGNFHRDDEHIIVTYTYIYIHPSYYIYIYYRTLNNKWEYSWDIIGTGIQCYIYMIHTYENIYLTGYGKQHLTVHGCV